MTTSLDTWEGTSHICIGLGGCAFMLVSSKRLHATVCAVYTYGQHYCLNSGPTPLIRDSWTGYMRMCNIKLQEHTDRGLGSIHVGAGIQRRKRQGDQNVRLQ